MKHKPRGPFARIRDKGKKIPKQKEASEQTASEYERCVLCGKLTPVPVCLPVDSRQDYISGVGQLCEDCAKDLK